MKRWRGKEVSVPETDFIINMKKLSEKLYRLTKEEEEFLNKLFKKYN